MTIEIAKIDEFRTKPKTKMSNPHEMEPSVSWLARQTRRAYLNGEPPN
jgi:hypothetical protein